MQPAPTIVCIDDDEIMGEWLSSSLPEFNVKFAVDARSGLALLEEDRPDAVLLDIVLPDQNGIDLLPRIREDYPGLPVILITGYGTKERVIEALREGAFDFIEKPIKIDSIEATVRRAIKTHRPLVPPEKTELAAVEEQLGALFRQIYDPLTTIRLNVRLLEGGGEAVDEAVLKQRHETIYEATRAIESVLSSLRTLVLGSEVRPLRPFSELMGSALGQLRDEAILTSARVDLSIAPGVLSAQQISTSLERVFYNIIYDAVSWLSEKDQRECVIRIEAVPLEAGLGVSVWHNGPHLPEEVLRWVMNIAGAQRPTEGQGLGRGLGLYVARLIVETHGGRLSVTNVEDGVSMQITIPHRA